MRTADYTHIVVEPASGALGAHIAGVDLAQPLDEAVFAEIHRAFLENLVIYFDDQDITPEQQCAFAARFGPLTRHPFIKTLPGFPEVASLVREADAAGLNFGGQWHCDGTFMEAPPLGSTLYGIEVPPSGGDTLFSNLHLAYETLSPGMRALADRLIVVHTAAVSYDPDRGAADPNKSKVAQKGMQFEVTDSIHDEIEHPLVRIHPESGRRLLFVGNGYQIRFKDMTEEESKPLFDFFVHHASRPEFQCRFSYRKGTLGVWDNRAVQHFAVNDYAGHRRVMHRVQIGGDRPYGPAMPLAERRRAA